MRTVLIARLAVIVWASAIAWIAAVEAHDPAASAARSSQWPKVRAAHLVKEPACVACGASGKGVDLEVHHVVPFHVDRAKELDPTNLITLCRSGGKLGCDCHLTFGHVGSFHRYNPDVRRDAERMRGVLKAAEAREAKSK